MSPASAEAGDDRGTPCALRPLRADDLPLFEEVYRTKAGSGDHQWFGFGTPGRGLAEVGAIGPGGGRLSITVNGSAVGSVFWFRREWGLPDTSWCWEIAVHVFPGCRGAGIGTHAQRLLVDYLFSHTRAWRLQATTDRGNLAEQRALERIGFRREGVLRDLQWREGSWHDQLIYSLLRPDRAAHEPPGYPC